MKNKTPEYFSYITKAENGTWIDLSGSSEYSADGFELIGIRSFRGCHYGVEEGVRSINLTSYTCPPLSITFPSTLEEIKNIADLLENGILYDSEKTEIFVEFKQLIGSEVTIPKTVSRITLDHSTLLDPRNNKLITIFKSSTLFELFKEKYGLFLNIVD